MSVQLQNEIEHKLAGRMAFASHAFLWLAVAGIIGALVAFAYVQRWFTPTIELYFYTQHAAGLSRGMAVKLIGFNIGSLEEISPYGELRVRGKIVIDSHQRDVIGKDSRIRLTKEGLLGAYVLELLPGQSDLGLVSNGATLEYERELDYNVMVQNLIDRMGPVLDDIRRVSSQLGDPEAGIKKTLRHFDDLAMSLSETSRDMSRLAAAGSRLAADGSRLAADGSRLTRDVPARMEPVLNDLHRNLVQLEALIKQLNSGLPPVLEDTRKLLQSAQATSESAQRVITEDVPRVLRRGENVLEDTDEIVDGVRRSWPVRNMLPQTQGNPLELDSADGAAHAVPRKTVP